jgi:16S rRNA (cytidine1402-2'-O)-methyltransferase
MLLYESPHRVEKTLKAILEAYGDRSAVLARELTKRYEEFARGTISECLAFLKVHPPLGEYCIVLQGQETTETVQPDAAWWNGLSVTEHVDGLMAQDETMSKKEAMKRAAEERGLARRDVYSLLIAEKSPGQG